MFEKLVAVDPIVIDSVAREQLKSLAKEIRYYDDDPKDEAELVRRIGDADAVLVSFRTPITGSALAQCPKLVYIGMCCSLYTPESANVDILAANQRGIVVKGVRDYGDEGVPEYVISELVRFLHGFYGPMWRDTPTELTGLNTGILGMGTTGQCVGRALRFFGANVYYYSRTRKPELEASEGYIYASLYEVLDKADILVTCLNRNTILLGKEEFTRFGDGKILMNISIGPGHDVKALEEWLGRGNNYAFGDTHAAIDPTGKLVGHPNVFTPGTSAGLSVQAMGRLGQKVLQNIKDFFADNPR